MWNWLKQQTRDHFGRAGWIPPLVVLFTLYAVSPSFALFLAVGFMIVLQRSANVLRDALDESDRAFDLMRDISKATLHFVDDQLRQMRGLRDEIRRIEADQEPWK